MSGWVIFTLVSIYIILVFWLWCCFAVAAHFDRDHDA